MQHQHDVIERIKSASPAWDAVDSAFDGDPQRGLDRDHARALLALLDLRDDVPSLMRDLARLLREGDREGARRRLEASPSAEAAVVMAGFVEVENGVEAAEEAMAGASALQRNRLEKRLAFLGTLGNNAPFIGCSERSSASWPRSTSSEKSEGGAASVRAEDGMYKHLGSARRDRDRHRRRHSGRCGVQRIPNHGEGDPREHRCARSRAALEPQVDVAAGAQGGAQALFQEAGKHGKEA